MKVGVMNMKIAIGTKNKAKTAAVKAVVLQYYPEATFEYVDVASGVSEQPFSTQETRQGAINRAQNTYTATKADMSFGLEGGVEQIGDELYCCNWGAVTLQDGTTLACGGAQFLLPKEIADELHAGKELGPVMDVYTQTKDIRHHAGAIGIFTNDLIDRKEMFEHVVKLLIGQAMFFQK